MSKCVRSYVLREWTPGRGRGGVAGDGSKTGGMWWWRIEGGVGELRGVWVGCRVGGWRREAVWRRGWRKGPPGGWMGIVGAPP